MKIRFYQYTNDKFTLEVKKWYGWTPIYMYGGAFSISKHFTSKEDGLNYLRMTSGINTIQLPTEHITPQNNSLKFTDNQK